MRLFIITLLILFYQSVVLACNFKIINFGDPQTKIKIDPALATGPFITTMNDVIGLLIYFLISEYMLL